MVRSSKVKKITLIVFLITITLGFFIILATWLGAKGTITRKQAKDIAYGYAVKECLAQKSSKLNCKSIRVSEPEGSCFEWYCNDPPMWSIYFETTQGGSFNGVIYLNIQGEPITEEELVKEYT